MSRTSGSYNVSSGFNSGDAAQAYQEREHELLLQALFKPNNVDHNEMPLLETKTPEGEVSKFAVSKTEGFMWLEENLMQIGAQAPVGKFVIANWPNIKVGDILPNGSEVLSVGTISLPEDFKPYKA
jgi:hypothetical protein